MKELLLLAVGSGLTLLGTLVQAAIQRRTSSSNRLFELRLEALTGVWAELISVRDIFAAKIPLGHTKWAAERGAEAKAALNRFRCEVDRSQVVLDGGVTLVLRRIDTYLYQRLCEDDQKPSDYAREFGALVKKLEAVVNDSMRRSTHRVSLSFHNE